MVVGGGDGGVLIPNKGKGNRLGEGSRSREKNEYSMSGGRESPEVVGQAPPSYGSGPGESIEGHKADLKH